MATNRTPLLASALLALGLIGLSAGLVSAGPDTGGSETAGPDTTESTADNASATVTVAGSPSEATPECRDLVAALDAQAALVVAFIAEDAEALNEVLESLPDLAAAAASSASEEIADDVDAWLAPVDAVTTALEGVDLSDPEAVGAALAAVSEGDEASNAAQNEVEAYAAEQCGWSRTDPFADAPEPPECDVLDPAVAAEAAAIDVDVTDDDGSGDFNLPGFWTKSCSYGNGVMSLSTLSFNDLDQVTLFYLDNVDADANNPGALLTVDLGALPVSSLVAQVGDSVTVSVFEASIPFSVTFTGAEVDAAAVVAAAEALLVAQPATDEATAAPPDATTNATLSADTAGSTPLVTEVVTPEG